MPILGVIASSKSGNLSSTFDLIENAQPSSQGSVTFSGLNAYANTYKHLRIIAALVTDISVNNTWANMRFNSDTGNNYYYSYIRGNNYNTPGFTTAVDNATQFGIGANQDEPSGGQNQWPFVLMCDIPDFASSNKWKTVTSVSGQYAIPYSTYTLGSWNGIWKNTNAITSITIRTDSGNWVTGSIFSLYGIK